MSHHVSFPRPRSLPVHSAKFRIFIGAFLFFALPWPAAAQDAKTILRTMMNTYAQMNSYQGKANVDLRQTLPDGREVSDQASTVTLYCKKPNLVKIDVSSPKGGRIVYCNDKFLVLYDSDKRKYRKLAITPKDLREALGNLRRAGVVSDSDTLYFLSGQSVRPAITGFTLKPDSTRNGRPVYVVTAHESLNASKLQAVWTWMIDKQTNLLARIEEHISNYPAMIPVIKNNKRAFQRATVNVDLTQNIVDPKPNANLDNDLFKFTAPQGASEVKATNAPASKGK